jgi:hypothetical protein
MSDTVQRLLESFEALSADDKHDAAVEILRRYSGAASGDLSDETLVALADELFQALDNEEARHASR